MLASSPERSLVLHCLSALAHDSRSTAKRSYVCHLIIQLILEPNDSSVAVTALTAHLQRRMANLVIIERVYHSVLGTIDN